MIGGAQTGRILYWTPVWFGDRSDVWVETMRPVDTTLGDVYSTPVDPLASELGVLPKGIDTVLYGERLSNGQWCRRSLQSIADLKEVLQITLIRGALEVWRARCRQMDVWWRSSEAEAFVRGRALQKLQRKRKRRITGEIRARAMFDNKMDRKKAKRLKKTDELVPQLRRSRRVPKPIQFFAPMIRQRDCADDLSAGEDFDVLMERATRSLPWY